ncbi:hypothetical protein J4731_13040 [Providencia rettgeri]|nr:hypothetical protein [Providencia rettgeri]
MSKQFANSENSKPSCRQNSASRARLRYGTGATETSERRSTKAPRGDGKQTALMSQASDQQVKALTADLNKQLALLKQKEDGLKKAETESQTIREALAKQQADAKALAEKPAACCRIATKAQQAENSRP